MFDVNKIREQFPIFKNNPDVIYFDNASTTQKPLSVIDCLGNFYMSSCSNIGRGSYSWAGENYLRVKEVREKVAKFINASQAKEVIFTNGATHSSNTITTAWGMENLKMGDEVMICHSDHKSTVLPWIDLQKKLEKIGVLIKIVPIKIHPLGDYDESDLYSKVNAKTKVVVLTHIHNVYGMEMSINNIVAKIRPKSEGCIIVLDAAQSIAHINIDVQKLDVDFLYFSGHKMFGVNGVGVLWVRKNLHDRLTHYMLGGDVGGVSSGSVLKKESDNLNEKLETGTLNIPAIISLGTAVDFINNIKIEEIEKYIFDLTWYLIENLNEFDRVEFLPGPAKCKCAVGYGIISFRVKGINSADVGFVLNEHKIFLRTGSHCLSKSDEEGSIRVSFQVYNIKEEIDKFVSVIREIALS